MTLKNLILALPLLAGLTGCADRLDHFNKPPTLSPVGEMRNPMSPPSQERYNVPPKHTASLDAQATSGSLWHSGPQSLFGDRRARDLGDIVTVVIEIDEEAEMKNKTTRSRAAADDMAVSSFMGLNKLAEKILPEGATLDPAIGTNSSTSSSGDGTIKREEKITLRVAATVTGVLPNGHLAITGTQEVRVNYELRELLVGGIIRPEDISRNNVITYDKIADARISYGGRGQITDVQRARYGQQIIDLVSPF